MKELFDNTMSCPKPKWYKGGYLSRLC